MATKSKESSLSPADVCAIIKACCESEVRVLKFANLYLEFGKKADSVPLDVPTPAPQAPVAEITDKQKHEADRALVSDELDLREDELAMMLIKDPFEAEKMLIADQLEDTDEPREEDDEV